MTGCLQEIAAASDCSDPVLLDETIQSFRPGAGSLIRNILATETVDETTFLRELGKVFTIPFWEDASVSGRDTKHLRKLLPAEIARRKEIVPVSCDGNGVVFASVDPLNLETHALVSRYCPGSFSWVFATRAAILEAIRNLYGVGDSSVAELIESRRSDLDVDRGDFALAIDDEPDEASLISLVNEIIRGALEQEATDIHLEPHGSDLRIRYRIDGKLREVPAPENIGSLQSSVISRIKIMANLDIAERRLPQDGRIHLELQGRSVDVRVATIPSVEGESVSLRLLGKEIFSIANLGMNERISHAVRKLLELPNGIILVTGPTGSGKSTSLYAFLQEINQADTRIVTIEDPVENKLPGVVQIAVKNDIGLTFARGLRSILRGDPNVIMVGEMRDVETAEIAIRAALTGHLVFSTLHTNDAVSGVTRLIDMGVEPFLVASSVRAFLAQRLVRKLCIRCRDKYRVPAAILDTPGLVGDVPIYRALGCQYCRGTGYRGRLAVFELAVVTRAMEDLIARRAPAPELLAQAYRDGYVPMREYGIQKVLQGETSLEEVLSVTAGSENSDAPVFPGVTNERLCI